MNNNLGCPLLSEKNQFIWSRYNGDIQNFLCWVTYWKSYILYRRCHNIEYLHSIKIYTLEDIGESMILSNRQSLQRLIQSLLMRCLVENPQYPPSKLKFFFNFRLKLKSLWYAVFVIENDWVNMRLVSV
jgi:hypothetical protein